MNPIEKKILIEIILIWFAVVLMIFPWLIYFISKDHTEIVSKNELWQIKRTAKIMSAIGAVIVVLLSIFG